LRKTPPGNGTICPIEQGNTNYFYRLETTQSSIDDRFLAKVSLYLYQTMHDGALSRKRIYYDKEAWEVWCDIANVLQNPFTNQIAAILDFESGGQRGTEHPHNYNYTLVGATLGVGFEE
jgi:hypothetical protein